MTEVSHFVSINGHSVIAICDIGADISVLRKDVVPNLVLQPTLTVLKAWGNIKLPVIGTVECKVHYKDVELQEKIFVVDVPSDMAKPLLSFTLVKQLGICYVVSFVG